MILDIIKNIKTKIKKQGNEINSNKDILNVIEKYNIKTYGNLYDIQNAHDDLERANRYIALGLRDFGDRFFEYFKKESLVINNTVDAICKKYYKIDDKGKYLKGKNNQYIVKDGMSYTWMQAEVNEFMNLPLGTEYEITDLIKPEWKKEISK